MSDLQHSELVQWPTAHGSIVRQVILQLVHVLIDMLNELGRWRLCPLLEVALERLFEREVGSSVQRLHGDMLRHTPLNRVGAAHCVSSVDSGAGGRFTLSASTEEASRLK